MPYKDKERQRQAQRAHYKKNKGTYVDSTKKRRIERAKWWADYKEAQNFSCLECGENHPACISFHHRDGAEKWMAVADIVGYAYPVERILEEITKCDILCHNCHSKHHWKNDHRRRNVVSIKTE